MLSHIVDRLEYRIYAAVTNGRLTGYQEKYQLPKDQLASNMNQSVFAILIMMTGS